MKRFILSILAVFAIAAAVVGCGSSNPSGLPTGNTELQGTWTWTEAGVTFTFSGNNWTITSTIGDQTSGTFTLDSATNPKTIDLYFATYSEPQAASQVVGKTALGLYLLSGTNLTLALGDPGTARPTSFIEDINTTTFNLAKGSNTNTGSNAPAAYNTAREEMLNAVVAYAVGHQGNFSTLPGILTVAECTDCSLVDMNALLVSNGGLLRAVPAGTYSTAGMNNDNCDGGASGCLTNNHYVWIINTTTDSVYSKCMGNDCASNDASGYQGIWP